MEAVRALGWGAISIFRRLFVGTPVQRWKVTSDVYAHMVHVMYAKRDIETSYKGVNLVLPSKDPSIVPPIIRGTYESFELDVYGALAENARTVLDVGGNIGLYAVVAGKRNADATVISFEPIRENVSYLQKNIEQNGLGNVTAVEAAVGAETGKIDIFLSDVSIGHHSITQKFDGSRNSKKSISVQMISLDDFVKEHKYKPELLKVDVEGYDYYVFKGAKEILKRYRPTIFAEFGPDMMHENGYQPEEFLDILFDCSDEAYIFDEIARKLIAVSKDELLREDRHTVDNLIFVSNKQHKKILKSFLA